MKEIFLTLDEALMNPDTCKAAKAGLNAVNEVTNKWDMEGPDGSVVPGTDLSFPFEVRKDDVVYKFDIRNTTFQ